MKNVRNIIVALSVALPVAAALSADAPKPVDVKTARLARGEITRYVTLPGNLKANQQATLCAKVAGYLKTLAVDKGDRVVAGQLLGEIEVPELAVEGVKYRAEIRVAEAEYKRITAARDSAPDLVTPMSVDEARGRLEIAKANLERLDTLLQYSKLTAPFAGVVTLRHVDPGAFIAAPTSGSSSQVAGILTLMDFNTIRAQVAIPETEAPQVQVGQPVRVSVEGLPGKTFNTSVSRIAYALDEATRTMSVEADLENPDLRLRPGMYAMIKVGVEKHLDALVMPIEALVMEKASAFTFVVANGKARKVPIRTAFNDGSRVEVTAGLSGDETVILAGTQPLVDGQAVNVLEARP